MKVKTFVEFEAQYWRRRALDKSYSNSLAEDIYAELTMMLADKADYTKRVEDNVAALKGELKLIRENWHDSMRSQTDFRVKLTLLMAKYWTQEAIPWSVVDTETMLQVLLDELESLRRKA